MNLEQLSELAISELTAAYKRGDADPVEVLELNFEQIDSVNGQLNAIYEPLRDKALAAAEAAAKRYRSGRQVAVLEGVPVTIKDSVNKAGLRWQHGSAAHGKGLVATTSAPPVEALERAGAIIIGKCTMPDFGLSASGVSSAHGIVRNPWGLDWNTGGSSAGAGASLAAGIGMMSVGSDIAGSVRLPASHCGLAALKPTQGLIAHTPASDVRSPGPMTRHPADLELLLHVLSGVHRDDRYSVPLVEDAAAPSFEDATVHVHAAFGFGPAVEHAVANVLAEARNAMASLVASVQAVPPAFDFDVLLPIDDSLRLRGWREFSQTDSGLRAAVPETLVNWFSPAADWGLDEIRAFEAGIERGISQTTALFDEAEFVLTPVMPLVNFPAESLGPNLEMPLRHSTFTAPFNQSGHPAVVVHAGYDARGLPIGVQIAARRFDDIRLTRLAAALSARMAASTRRDNGWPLNPIA